MIAKQKQLLIKLAVIAVPTYAMAWVSEAMVWTMPTLAITLLIAANLFTDAEESQNRVDEGESDGGDLDG